MRLCICTVSPEPSQLSYANSTNILWAGINGILCKLPDKGAYLKIIFLISQPKHVGPQWDGSFEHPKHRFQLMGEKIVTLLHSIHVLIWTCVNRNIMLGIHYI